MLPIVTLISLCVLHVTSAAALGVPKVTHLVRGEMILGLDCDFTQALDCAQTVGTVGSNFVSCVNAVVDAGLNPSEDVDCFDDIRSAFLNGSLAMIPDECGPCVGANFTTTPTNSTTTSMALPASTSPVHSLGNSTSTLISSPSVSSPAPASTSPAPASTSPVAAGTANSAKGSQMPFSAALGVLATCGIGMLIG